MLSGDSDKGDFFALNVFLCRKTSNIFFYMHISQYSSEPKSVDTQSLQNHLLQGIVYSSATLKLLDKAFAQNILDQN